MLLPITEIFTSIQGEGIFAGQPQVFIRVAGCNIYCTYCDTTVTEARELSTTQVADLSAALAKKSAIKVASVTGGEPLLYPSQLKELLPLLKQKELKIYLETNGTLYEEFKQVAARIDYCAMDIKLPSACKQELWAEHKKFLSILADKMRPGYYFVKIVINSRSTDSEIARAVKLIAGTGKGIPLVLQPCTLAKGRIWFDQGKILRFLGIASRSLTDVRVIPQLHTILGLR